MIGSTSKVSALEITRWRLMAVAGLRLLTQLQRLVPSFHDKPPLDLVMSLAAFTDERDLWTNAEASEAAAALLLDLLRHASADDPMLLSKLLASLLRDKVKPPFVESRTSAITEQGRKASYRLRDTVAFGDSELGRKPWKFRDVHIVTVFRWILGKLDVCSTVYNHIETYTP